MKIFLNELMKIIVIIIIGFFIQASLAAPLTPPEKQIADYVNQQKTSQVGLLKKIVNINSGTSNIKGVRKVGEIMRRQLKQLGFKTYWVEEPRMLHRAGTLIAERKGKKGKRLLLISHLDTVSAPDSKFKRMEVHGNSAKGPGITDDKGGLMVLLYALKALNATHSLNDATITVVLTGDEEDSGKPTSISRKPLVNAAQNKDIALDFEPAVTLETVSIARRGVTNWQLETQGNEAHSATIFLKDVGDGAIFEISRILQTMLTQLKDEKDLSFNPGMILGGTKLTYDNKTTKGTVFGKQNVVASHAMARGDLRYVSEEQKKSVEAKMLDMIKQPLPGTSAFITFQDGPPAMPATAENMKLLEQYSAASVDLNLGLVKPFAGLRGAGDISFVAALIPANLVGLGPVGAGTHSIAESIDLTSLPIQTQRAAVFMYRLIQ